MRGKIQLRLTTSSGLGQVRSREGMVEVGPGSWMQRRLMRPWPPGGHTWKELHIFRPSQTPCCLSYGGPKFRAGLDPPTLLLFSTPYTPWSSQTKRVYVPGPHMLFPWQERSLTSLVSQPLPQPLPWTSLPPGALHLQEHISSSLFVTLYFPPLITYTYITYFVHLPSTSRWNGLQSPLRYTWHLD